jgi:excisionase family DNA binding protein
VPLETAARYLGVSTWTLQDIVEAGGLRLVHLPMPGGRPLRKMLVDLQDLDALIARSKG